MFFFSVCAESREPAAAVHDAELRDVFVEPHQVAGHAARIGATRKADWVRQPGGAHQAQAHPTYQRPSR